MREILNFTITEKKILAGKIKYVRDPISTITPFKWLFVALKSSKPREKKLNYHAMN